MMTGYRWQLIGVFVSILAGFYGTPCSAEVPKCIDAQNKIREQLDPLIELGVRSYFPQYQGKYTLAMSKFYPTNETDNARDCVATVTLTTNDGLHSGADVSYRVVATEDGEILTQLSDFNSKGLILGLAFAGLGSAQQGQPADGTAKDFYAPQGQGSFADRVRRNNREHGQ